MNKIKLPKNWNDVKVRQFIELKELITLNENNSDFSKSINILCTLADIDIFDDIWNNIYLSDLLKFGVEIQFMNHPPSNEFKHKLNNFIIKDLDDLTLGEFIDIDRFLQEDIINLPKICAILYRKYKTDEYNNIILEKYDNINLEERSELFNDVSINDVFGILNYLINFKAIISKNYLNIFEPNLSDEDLEQSDYDDIVESKKEQLQSKFSWELLIYSITKGDLTKYDAILELNFIFVLNQLSIKKAFDLD